jgi:hypothetical protein
MTQQNQKPNQRPGQQQQGGGQKQQDQKKPGQPDREQR